MSSKDGRTHRDYNKSGDTTCRRVGGPRPGMESIKEPSSRMSVMWFRNLSDKQACLELWLHGCRGPSFSEGQGALRSSSSTFHLTVKEPEDQREEVTWPPFPS